jgi:hypothetical protein
MLASKVAAPRVTRHLIERRKRSFVLLATVQSVLTSQLIQVFTDATALLPRLGAAHAIRITTGAHPHWFGLKRADLITRQRTTRCMARTRA